MKSLSVIIPVYNEVENIAKLHAEVVAMCKKNDYTFEVIIVDDGSSDGTVEEVKKLLPVQLIEFRKNFGQTAAFDAGIKAAKYDFIATMDGDGQNDPADIPAMLEYLENEKLDVVSGWRKNRKDSFMKHFVSRGANALRFFLINDGINDSGCSLKVYRRECFHTVSLYGEMHRFIPAILKIRGFKVGEVVVSHRARTAGITKYNWQRTIKGFVDMVSVWFWNKYAVRPLHLLGGLGLVFILMGMLSACYAIYEFIWANQSMSDSATPILTTFFFLTGMQLFVFGLIADALLKSYFETTKNQPYFIKSTLTNTKNV